MNQIVKPNEVTPDPNLMDLDGKARAQKCLEAVKIVCEKFQCSLIPVAVMKPGNMEMSILCNPISTMTPEQEASVQAAQEAMNAGLAKPEAPTESPE